MLKKWLWTGAALLLALVIGFIGGAVIHPGFKPGGTIITNYVQGTNTVQYIYEYKDATNNLPEIYAAYLHFSKDKFEFIQQNDTMTVNLYTRAASIKIKQWQSENGLILGGGWDIMRTAPAILGGYHWKSLAVFGTATISTNFGIAIFGAWIF